ncbi:MAG: hypothetical protein IJQ33_03220 [Clostridia bacterium]|nr:hypothetical protein [Clostridia bacterium]
MRTLLVSADLTADLISATGGNRRFVPSRKPSLDENDISFASFIPSEDKNILGGIPP